MPRRDREQVARDLKPINTALDADAALQALEEFDERWGERFPPTPKSWRDAWEQLIPSLAFPPEVRRVIHTTDENVKRFGGVEAPVSGDGLVAAGAPKFRTK